MFLLCLFSLSLVLPSHAAMQTFTKEYTYQALDKAIELDPMVPEFYGVRGSAYNNLGNRQQAIANWQIGARLGDKSIQEFLRGQFIRW